MKKYFNTIVVGLIILLSGCAQPGGTQSDIDALKAGQNELRKELAEIKKLLSAKPKRVGDVNYAMNVSSDPYKGSKTADLTIVEYTDYQCPYCARHAQRVLPEIVKNYVDTGKVRYVLRDFPLASHKNAPKAAEAAHCAGDQGKYWEMHDTLFANQRALGADRLPEYARVIGIDVGTFDACLASGKYKGRISANLGDGRKSGVRGTPSFVIGYTQIGSGEVKGEKLIRGAAGYATFQAAFEELLVRKK